TSASNGGPPKSSRSHAVRLPEVAIPAAMENDPRSTPRVDHILSLRAGPSAPATRNIVEPYMSISAPGERTSTETASAQASIVPGEPEELGAERLTGEHGAAAGEDGGRSEPLGELLHLFLRTGVDAVEDGRPQGPVVVVARDDAWADAADCDARHRVRAAGEE